MRALLVHPGPDFSVADVYRGWRKGLAACGVTVAEYNLGDRISFFATTKLERDGETRNAFDNETALRLAVSGMEAACFRWWPDVVVVVSGFFVPASTLDVIRGRGMRVVLIHTESPYEDDKQLERAPHADVNVLNDPTNLGRFAAVAPSLYLPHAYDPDVHYPRPTDPEMASDFFFCGTGFPSRLEFFAQVDFTGITVRLGGNWQALLDEPWVRDALVHDPDECLPNDETVGFYTSTKCSVNLYRTEANHPELTDGWAVGPREVELAACGTFFLRDPRPEGDALFPMLPTFTDPADFTDKLRWWLAHDIERQAAATQARAAVAERTFAHHAAKLLTTLDT